MKTSRTSTPNSTGRHSVNSSSTTTSSSSPSSHSSTSPSTNKSTIKMTIKTVKVSQNTDSKNQPPESAENIDSNGNSSRSSQLNNHSFSSTDSGRSSISSSQTSNGDEVNENHFKNKSKITSEFPPSDIDDENSNKKKKNVSGSSNNSSGNSNNNNTDNTTRPRGGGGGDIDDGDEDDVDDGQDSPTTSAELDIYSDVTLIPKSTINIDFTTKVSKKSTKRVNVGRKPMKGITAKSTRPNLTNGTIPTDAVSDATQSLLFSFFKSIRFFYRFLRIFQLSK
ncbi:unnamed protein product [Trichobilharzia regenti]|nr:unnamed protein product [Trichobilharzia regenti]